FVTGLQGDRPPYLRVAACAKHFAAHSGPEAGRDSFDSVVSDKDLNETYLPAFRTLVDAGVAGVMCAYNRVGGRPCCGDSPLISDVLRNAWNFEGYVVSDCGAIHDIHAHHKVTSSPVESAAMALRGGVDLNCGGVYASLREAHEQGLIDVDVIDRALRRLLTIRMRLGEFDTPDTHPYAKTNDNCVASPAHVALAKETALKSAVLLKNANHTLPLRPDTHTVYVTGPNAASVDVLLGNYRGVSGDLVTILEGVVNAAGPARRVHYNMGALLNTPNANNSNLVAYQAADADAVIAVLGTSPLMEGESGDAIASVDGGDRSDLSLPPNQLDLLRRLRSATKKPIVLVLTGGSPIVSPEIHDLADAILFAWYPGEAGGAAIGDLIFGRAAPSGRLPISFPMSLDDLPPYDEYSMRGRTYRFATTEPLYPFGFGLSYATFRYSSPTVESTEIENNTPLAVRFQLTNDSDVEAEEVVQYYLTPIHVVPDAPQYALCGFQRVRLKPGERRMIARSIPPTDLTTTDARGQRITRPGRYRLTIGGASPGARTEALGAATPLTMDFTILASHAPASRDVESTNRN
ncbi:MAG: glycoside hydrolase family 3 C-terminal domain-containing protein, partial [Phycisphaerales bacterium]|nr:glycoside hydrolase family 3 C-terminal domain-containing protein [Phycisphaerales bacterium]